MLTGLPDDAENGIDGFHLLTALLQIGRVDAAEWRQLFSHLLFGNGQILRDALIETQSAVALLVERLHVADELLTLMVQLFRLTGVLLGRLDLSHPQHLVHLFQKVLLCGLVGVQFQAERSQVDLLQSRLHDGEGRHLLCHEEHALALIEGVGYHVGNGLRLTRPWRTMQNEAASTARLHNGLHLRRVHIERNGKVQRCALFVYRARIDRVVSSRLLVVVVNQRCHDGVLFQLIGIGMNVVPHDKLVKREQAQHGLLDDVPLLLLNNGTTEVGENELHVNAALVLRQHLQHVEVDFEVLLQQFHQRDVQDDVLVALTHDVVVATAAHHVDGQQQDGRIAGLLALGRLIPLQHAQSQEQAVGTILLKRRTGRSIDVLQGVLQFHVRQVRRYFVVTYQFRYIPLILSGLLPRVVHAVGPWLHLFAWRGHDAVVLAILQVVFQMLNLERDEGHDTPSQTCVQQIVAQREVEQLALPYHLLRGGLPSVLQPQVVVVQRAGQLSRRRVGRLVSAFTHHLSVGTSHPLWQRTDVAQPATVNVNEVEELAVVVQLLGGTPDGILEADGSRLRDGRRLQQHQVVVAVGHFLQQIARIVAGCLREHGGRQPGSHHGMPFQQHHDGIDAHRLQARSHEQTGVEARAGLLGQHLVGQADALARGLEAGGRCRVDNALGTQGLVDGGHLRPHAVAVLRLVLVEGRRAGPLLQIAGSGHFHPRQLRIVGHDEGSQVLGHHRAARPFVEGQQLNGQTLLADHAAADSDAHGELRLHGLGQLAQHAEVGFYLHGLDLHRLSWPQCLYAARAVLDVGARHRHLNVVPVALIGILYNHRIANFHAVVHHGVVHTRQIINCQNLSLHLHLLFTSLHKPRSPLPCTGYH